MKINKISFPSTQFFKEETPKKIIVLHHTASGEGIEGDIRWWNQTKERVGTHYIIGRDGFVAQLVDDKYWIHHLGIKQHYLNMFGSKVTNTRLNQLSIGIETDSWGGLVKKDGKWYSYVGKEVDCKDVIEYPRGYRGYFAFERYTDKQINSLKSLLELLTAKYSINRHHFVEMFDFNEKAVKGYHGIWSHSSFRPDKSDMHPQPELILMLKELSNK